MSFYNINFFNEVGAIGFSILGSKAIGTHINLNAKFLMMKYLFEELKF